VLVFHTVIEYTDTVGSMVLKNVAKQGSIEHMFKAWLEQMLQPTHYFRTI
jgi:hypothetical protein